MDASAALLFTSDLLAAGDDPRAIAAAVRRGSLVRLRRGVYIPSGVWEPLPQRERHLLHLHAIERTLRLDGAFCGYSAAAIWDLPTLAGWPQKPALLVRYRGGGTSEPQLLRTSAGWRASDVTRHAGLRVTDPARTAIDLIRRDGLSAVGSVDALLRGAIGTREQLAARLETWPVRLGRHRIIRVVEFADPKSESFGESIARVAIARAGFPAPLIQHELRDHEGSMFPDFFWPEFAVAAEFDGKQKYVLDEYTRGDPAAVVWKEKLREDRLRALGLRVVRLVWSDLGPNGSAVRLLAAAGLPRGHPSLAEDPRRLPSPAP